MRNWIKRKWYKHQSFKHIELAYKILDTKSYLRAAYAYHNEMSDYYWKLYKECGGK